jgi:hypothetical protein
MGKEANCVARFGGKKSTGKVLLETSELIFRGDFRLRIALASLKSVKAAQGELRIDTPEGPAVFQLGEQAAKWCDKILHPKSRIEKLGIKADARVSLFGEFEREFLDELAALTKNVVNEKLDAHADWVFLSAVRKKDLAEAAKLAKKMAATAGLWVIYSKGQKELTENDVLAAGRGAGLKDVKVVGFSATHTGLKFVVPLDKR